MELDNLLEVVKKKTNYAYLHESDSATRHSLEKQLQDEESIQQDLPLEFISRLKELSRKLENAKQIASVLDWNSYFYYASTCQDKVTSLEMIKLVANCFMQVPVLTKQLAHSDCLKSFTQKVFERENLESQNVYLRFLFIFLSYQGADTCINLNDLTFLLVKRLEAIWNFKLQSVCDNENLSLYAEILRILFPLFRIGSIEESTKLTYVSGKYQHVLTLFRALPILIKTWSKYAQDEDSTIRWHSINAILECSLKNITSSQACEIVGLAIKTLHSIVKLETVEQLEGHYLHLESAISLNTSASLEKVLVPILCVLYSIMHIERVQEKLKFIFLPEECDRVTSLKKGKSLACLLLRLSMIPLLENISIWHGTILFRICDCNADLLTKEVGYGYASGILNRVKHSDSSNIIIPESTGNSLKPENFQFIDPITGEFKQRSKQPSSSSTMTMEEKEREAERLFILFQRLEKNGAMQVTNPIRQAIDSGHYQELDDTYSQ
ncbi:Ric8 family guanine nucleotide exchange factor synembryn family protein [Schizosaccharomyces octosporus yFS286]|uniref:Ric8 family guanine nucleotide exchange factor synembryn family protein n=1 Tax=Schizosaccharomyces octosporus (strain yFS286) TaxID=483514 RepID=S9Q1U7_SCHOY|nr:Ric8 family guanine nucleotide exchange factor synembryn family protein [Schizosaccharomyces octosporus yFS286]EPX74077.1 Ric8 family guanine nucleotide exchange factor synembryn family protein [Schizosaccharomyces octosporus yFS286]